MRTSYLFFFIKLWSCTEQILSAQGHTKAAFQRNHLDSERNEAVVSLNVSLEDFGAGAEHSFKAGPVQLHTLEGSTCHHRGRPGPVEQQGYLTWKQGQHTVTRPALFQKVHIPPSSRSACRTSPFIYLLIDTLHNSVDSKNALHMHNACV